MTSTPSQPSAANVQSKGAKCGMCRQRESLYTCPRCSLRTCSLPCSSKHKAALSCSGERNKAFYVPMNQYSWGTMMNDYTFLEDIGRRVGDWGREIVTSGLNRNSSLNTRSRGRVRNRGNGRLQRGNIGLSKRETLQLELEGETVTMELLPDGMEKRKMNQSTWDTKTGAALLTIEYKFHPPRNMGLEPLSFTTHRNSWKTPLGNLVKAHVEKKEVPGWVKELVNEEFAYSLCLILQWPPEPPGSAHYSLDPTLSLKEALRGKCFVEFPRVEFFRRSEFTGRLVSGSDFEAYTPPAKRKKLDDGQALKGLLDYTSENGEDNEEEEQSALTLDYESDHSTMPESVGVLQVNSEDEESSWDSGGDIFVASTS